MSLATSTLLQAVGHVRATTTAGVASTQWLLRDGFGSLGSVVFAWWRGGRVDAEVKAWQLRSDIGFTCGLLLDLCTAFAPHRFFQLASMASLLKGASAMGAGATIAALRKTFTREQNLGDVTAKGHSQVVVANLLGLAGGVVVINLLPPTALLGPFAIAALLHIFFGWRAVRSVQVSTLSRWRLDFILHAFVETGRVPTPAEAARREPVLFPGASWSRGVSWLVQVPVKHGNVDSLLHRLGDTVVASLVLHHADRYALVSETQSSGLPLLHLLLRPSFRREDILQGLLQSVLAYTLLRGGYSETDESVWSLSRKHAKSQRKRLVDSMREAGWILDSLHVDPHECAHWYIHNEPE